MERLVGAPMQRILADRGYRGHNAPPDRKFRVFITGQRRRMTKAIKREMKRPAAVESVIGHAKTDHRMGRNFLAHAIGHAATAVDHERIDGVTCFVSWMERSRKLTLAASSDPCLPPLTRR
jgi:IS5 family transposase